MAASASSAARCIARSDEGSLLFARPTQPRSAPVDAASLLENVVALIRHDSAIKDVTIDFAGSTWPIARTIGASQTRRLAYLLPHADGARVDLRHSRRVAVAVTDLVHRTPLRDTEDPGLRLVAVRSRPQRSPLRPALRQGLRQRLAAMPFGNSGASRGCLSPNCCRRSRGT